MLPPVGFDPECAVRREKKLLLVGHERVVAQSFEVPAIGRRGELPQCAFIVVGHLQVRQ